jgi:hypothetical protein
LYGSLQAQYEQLKAKYDSLNSEHEILKKLMADGQVVPLTPEQTGIQPEIVPQEIS